MRNIESEFSNNALTWRDGNTLIKLSGSKQNQSTSHTEQHRYNMNGLQNFEQHRSLYKMRKHERRNTSPLSIRTISDFPANNNDRRRANKRSRRGYVYDSRRTSPVSMRAFSEAELPRNNYERQTAERSYRGYDIDLRRSSPVSIRSISEAEYPRNNYERQTSVRSHRGYEIDVRRSSPVSMRSISEAGSTQSVREEIASQLGKIIATAFRNNNSDKNDLLVLTQAYNKLMKKKSHRRIAKKKKLSFFLRSIRSRNDDDCDGDGSHTSSSDDLGSAITEVPIRSTTVSNRHIVMNNYQSSNIDYQGITSLNQKKNFTEASVVPSNITKNNVSYFRPNIPPQNDERLSENLQKLFPYSQSRSKDTSISINKKTSVNTSTLDFVCRKKNFTETPSTADNFTNSTIVFAKPNTPLRKRKRLPEMPQNSLSNSHSKGEYLSTVINKKRCANTSTFSSISQKKNCTDTSFVPNGFANSTFAFIKPNTPPQKDERPQENPQKSISKGKEKKRCAIASTLDFMNQKKNITEDIGVPNSFTNDTISFIKPNTPPQDKNLSEDSQKSFTNSLLKSNGTNIVIPKKTIANTSTLQNKKNTKALAVPNSFNSTISFIKPNTTLQKDKKLPESMKSSLLNSILQGKDTSICLNKETPVNLTTQSGVNNTAHFEINSSSSKFSFDFMKPWLRSNNSYIPENNTTKQSMSAKVKDIHDNPVKMYVTEPVSPLDKETNGITNALLKSFFVKSNDKITNNAIVPENCDVPKNKTNKQSISTKEKHINLQNQKQLNVNLNDKAKTKTIVSDNCKVLDNIITKKTIYTKDKDVSSMQNNNTTLVKPGSISLHKKNTKKELNNNTNSNDIKNYNVIMSKSSKKTRRVTKSTVPSPKPLLSKDTKNSILAPQNITDNKSLSNVDKNSDISLYSSSDVSLRPSFLRRKLFTQTLEIDENKDPQSNKDDSLITINSLPYRRKSASKARQKVRRTYSNRSYLLRSSYGEKNNQSNLLDLIHKIVPPDCMNVATTLGSKNKSSTNEVNTSISSNTRSKKKNKLDIYSILSSKDEFTLSDTWTDDDTNDSEYNEHKRKFNDAKFKKCEVQLERLHLNSNSKIPQVNKPTSKPYQVGKVNV